MVLDRGKRWVLKAEVVASSWDKSLVIPSDLQECCPSLMVGLSVLLLKVQIQQEEEEGAFLTLEADCSSQGTYQFVPQRTILADGPGGFEGSPSEW